MPGAEAAVRTRQSTRSPPQHRPQLTPGHPCPPRPSSNALSSDTRVPGKTSARRLVSFWWAEYSFQTLSDRWTFGLYLFVASYAIALFLLATIHVPGRMEGVTNSYDYFMDGRRWLFVAFAIVIGFDIADTLLKGADYAARPTALWQCGVYLLAAVSVLSTRRRTLQLAAATVTFVLQLAYMFQQLGVLGGR